MGKLVLLNDRNQIIKTLDDDIAEREVDAFLKEYERLVANESDFNKVVTENEIKLNAILKQFTQPNAEKHLYPIFQNFLEEYETKKKLNNRIENWFSVRSSIAWEFVKGGFIRGINFISKKFTKSTWAYSTVLKAPRPSHRTA